MISTLYTNLKTDIQNYLGSEWKALPHMMDVSENQALRQSKCWSCFTGSIGEVNGQTGLWHGDLEISVDLADHWASSVQGDSPIVQRFVEMQDKMLGLFAHLVKTKIQSPDIVVNISGLNVSEPLLLKKEKVLVLEGTFKVRVRTRIQI